MKKKLKRRIKLIKLMLFLFGFLVFIGLFIGLQSTGVQGGKKVATEDTNKIGAIFPREFMVQEGDYKIPNVTMGLEAEQSDTRVASDNAIENKSRQTYLETQSIAAQNSNIKNIEHKLEIPEIFQSDANRTLQLESPLIERDINTVSNQNKNTIESAIQEITDTRKLIEKMQDDNQFIEQGRNSSLFVGASSNSTGSNSNSVLGNMTNKLDTSISQLLERTNTKDSFSIQNAQDNKISYLENQSNTLQNYSLSSKGAFYSEYEDTLIIAGTVIPIAMVTGIDSDLPGMISARVTEDVYDSLYGTDILIPQGSMLIGSYDSSLSWGQKRLILVWNRLSRPDGYHLNLEAMQGIDSQGGSGVRGRVKSYIAQSLASSALTSLFNLGINYTSYKINESDTTGLLQDTTDEASSGFKNTINNLANKFLNRQPTIKIKPGTKTYVFVNKDMFLPSFRGAKR